MRTNYIEKKKKLEKPRGEEMPLSVIQRNKIKFSKIFNFWRKSFNFVC